MYRSTIPHPHPHPHTYLYAALALLATVVVVITIVVARENMAAIPTTSRPVNVPPVVVPQNASPTKIDVGAGGVLNLETGQLIIPGAQLKPQPRTIELGNGYTLKISGRGEGQITAPARPATAYQNLDLGGGYMLKVSGDYGQIAAAPAYAAPQMRVIQKVDLGAGYTLVLHPSSGAVVAPVNSNPILPVTHKTDLGGGYWLETWQDGGQIIQAGTR